MCASRPKKERGKQMKNLALRESEQGKGRFDLIPPEAMIRLARWYEADAAKYGERNWEKGLPISRCISAAFRHLYQYLDGWEDEDHLAAVAWNVMAIMWFEVWKPEMQDLPARTVANGIAITDAGEVIPGVRITQQWEATEE